MGGNSGPRSIRNKVAVKPSLIEIWGSSSRDFESYSRDEGSSQF